MWLFTANDHYYPGHLRKQQQRIASVQGHASYAFRNRVWMGVAATWFGGGDTRVEGMPTPMSSATRASAPPSRFRRQMAVDEGRLQHWRVNTPGNDAGVQRGLVDEAGLKLEAEINRRLGTTAATGIHVVFVPAARDELLPWLIDGRGDLIASGIAVTPERARLVDFTTPTNVAVNQILVSGPGAPAIRTLDDLSGGEVVVRENRAALPRLVSLNAELKRRGRAPMIVDTVPRTLEDEDLLEMVNAGLIHATVVDEFTGRFWANILPDLALHPAIVILQGVPVAWAARKGSAELVAALNPIIEANRVGTAFGNALLTKYLKLARLVGRATSGAELARFRSLTALFKKYLDLRQEATSRVGAIGIMQIMPATAQEMNTGDVRRLEPNIHAGLKYIRWIIDRFVTEEGIDPLNRTLFALAAYNCGTGRLRALRREALRRGLDPNTWFDNVERITGERIGRETVNYVSSIYKYHVSCRLAEDRRRQGIA